MPGVPFEKVTFLRRIKQMLLAECAGRDEINGIIAKPVHGRMWPILGRQLQIYMSQRRQFE
jgi:hypothetical protein